MNTTKKLMLAILMVANYATISAVRNSQTADATTTSAPKTYTSTNIATWIDQVQMQAKNVQNALTPTDKDVNDTSSLLTTMQSYLLVTPDSSVQPGQIDQLKAGIVALQAFLNKYAYTFTNNAPFSVTLSPGMQWNTDKTTRNKIVLDTTKTSDPVYSLTPFVNASAGSTITSIRNYYRNEQTNESCDISLIKSTNGNSSSNSYQFQLTQTSTSGKSYTNKTGFHIKMTSKPKGHNKKTTFELDNLQSTGSGSNDKMQEIWIDKLQAPQLPQASDKTANLDPGHYAIAYDKATNKLSITLVPASAAV